MGHISLFAFFIFPKAQIIYSPKNEFKKGVPLQCIKIIFQANNAQNKENTKLFD